MKDENYRPAYIEFNVAQDGSSMPENLGTYENEQQISEFFATSGLITVNHALTVSRHMDMKEKIELRTEYNDVLENQLPIEEKDLSKALHEMEDAKRNVKNCQESVNAAMTKVKSLAVEVKHGVKEMKLDDIYTHRIAYRGRYYFYTWIDKMLRLCAFYDIPESEKGEIWNQMAPNERFIDDNFGNEDESVDMKYLKGEITSGEYVKEIVPNISKTIVDLLDEKKEAIEEPYTENEPPEA